MTNPDFKERLARIEMRANEQSKLQPAATVPVPQAKTPRSGMSDELYDFVMAPFAFLIGLGAVVFGKWVQYHAMSDNGWFDLSLFGIFGLFSDIIIAVCASIVLSIVFRLHSSVLGTAEGIGFFLGLFGMHLVIALVPDLFVLLFSEDYVYHMLSDDASYDDW